MLQKHELPKEAISKGIQCADMSAGPITIHILVGLDLYWTFMSINIIRISDNLVTQETAFGFVLSGVHDSGPVTRSKLSHQLFVATENDIRNLWALETMGIREEETVEDNNVY